MIQLHFRDVSKFFGETIAVDHVTLDVEEGELFFLLGPSGCGKSTFLRTIAGFYQPDTGELYFDDRLMNDVPPHKRNIGMVFQNYALWPHMTVYQNVEYGLNVRKLPDEEKKKRVYEVLEIVRMEKYATRNPNQLSGGQQQRIALARALVIEPDVLLLDEPLSNLDAKLRLEMRKEIKRIHSEAGITSVYVTHDQKEALSLADRAAVMENGKIIQVGNPRQIYNLPINKFVAGFIGETNFIDGKVKSTSSKDIIMDTEIGEIHSIFADHDFNSGEDVTCSVRPESIVISGIKQDNIPNQFAATISSVIYLGDVEEYWLDVADTWEIKAVLHNPGQQERKSGDQLYINFQPLDAVCLPVET